VKDGEDGHRGEPVNDTADWPDADADALTNAVYADEGDGAAEDGSSGSRFDTWRRRSAVGGLATGIALGLRDIFQPGRNTPVLTAEAPGDPPDTDERIRVILDPDDPSKSVAILPAPDPPTGVD
jgi:hypothetical protein